MMGAGRIGAAVAHQIAMRGLCDIRLVDIIQGLPQGEGLDITHMISEWGIDIDVSGSNDFRDLAGSEIVVVSAGLPRKPGMTRMDLLQKNSEIIREVSGKIAEYCPDTKLLMVTNPMDAMTYLSLKVTKFPRERVFGMGGMLDVSRFKSVLAEKLGVSRASLHALVVGEHGESMIPLPRFSTVNGNRVSDLLTKEAQAETIDLTRKIAIQVIAQKGATVFAPTYCVSVMVDAILRDRKMVEPCSAYLDGEYGFRDLCIGVPVVLGAAGMEKIIELPFDAEEKALFAKSVETLRTAISTLTPQAVA
jgi:malate dehydrogenase